MNIQSEREIREIVCAFESGAMTRSGWRHREHLVVALYYVAHSPTLSDALNKMRAGIFSLLKGFEIDLSVDMPYHETLTVFWIRTVAAFAELRNGASLLEICNELIETFGKDYPLKFYSRKILFSDDARKHFVEPDLNFANKKTAFDYESVSDQN